MLILKHVRSLSLLALFVILASLNVVDAQDIDIPELSARVTDLTGTLTSSEQRQLDQKLQAFEQSKGSQIVVLILPTTGDESIEQYSIRVAEKWQIGRGDVDDGIILLVAKDDRKVRIEVGYGLEGPVPDAYAKRIIERIILPEFRAGHFFDGVNEAVDTLIGMINEEPLPEVVSSESAPGTSGRGSKLPVVLLVFGFIAYSVILSMLQKRMGKFKGALVAIIFFSVAALLIGGLVAFFIVLIFTLFSSVASAGRGRYYGGGAYWGSGRSGGGFGGFGGGGGFSGGGGSFGGGGASGGW